MDQKYDNIGQSYNQTRQADPRILQIIITNLDLDKGSQILDVGAGTGNYSYQLAGYGYQVHALEPSEVMIRQGKNHENLSWHQGTAEDIPFEEETFDGAICILSAHHFQEPARSFQEIRRVLKRNGVVILFTNDPRLCPADFWYQYYFNGIIRQAYQYHPPLQEFITTLTRIFNSTVNVSSFPIPYDLQDGFFFSAWRYPERYLDDEFCRGISSLAVLPEAVLKSYQEKLKQDLNNGFWRQKFGDLLEKPEYDCGYFFLKARRNEIHG